MTLSKPAKTVTAKKRAQRRTTVARNTGLHATTSDLVAMLDADDRWRASVGARVVASELTFGMEGRPPVEVAVPGGRVLMRGSADKVGVGVTDASGVADTSAHASEAQDARMARLSAMARLRSSSWCNLSWPSERTTIGCDG